MAEVCMKRHGHAKQLVVFFGAASIGTGGGWGADAVLRACCKVARRSSQATTPAAASEPGPSTPPPAKRSKRTEAEQAAEPSQPTRGKGKSQGKAAEAKPAPQPGRWLDRDCNAALNMQRIGESRDLKLVMLGNLMDCGKHNGGSKQRIDGVIVGARRNRSAPSENRWTLFGAAPCQRASGRGGRTTHWDHSRGIVGGGLTRLNCAAAHCLPQQLQAEREEEAKTNLLMRRLEQLKREKLVLATEVEQEEEFLTNTLQKRLEKVQYICIHLSRFTSSIPSLLVGVLVQVASEKAELEVKVVELKRQAGGKHAFLQPNVLTSWPWHAYTLIVIPTVVRHWVRATQTEHLAAEKAKLCKEKVDLEATLELESEFIVNSLQVQLGKLGLEKKSLLREKTDLQRQVTELGQSVEKLKRDHVKLEQEMELQINGRSAATQLLLSCCSAAAQLPLSIGESMQRPIELCQWDDLEALPAIGEEYQQRYKLVNDRLPKGRHWLHRAAEYRRGLDGRMEEEQIANKMARQMQALVRNLRLIEEKLAVKGITMKDLGIQPHELAPTEAVRIGYSRSPSSATSLERSSQPHSSFSGQLGSSPTMAHTLLSLPSRREMRHHSSSGGISLTPEGSGSGLTARQSSGSPGMAGAATT
ncbi:hypothetical protein QJQ45_029263 [Haematococcus lacustris]|nr:hypothetical protein QJQ45_029263 [Haematococcus lacustris]